MCTCFLIFQWTSARKILRLLTFEQQEGEVAEVTNLDNSKARGILIGDSTIELCISLLLIGDFVSEWRL